MTSTTRALTEAERPLVLHLLTCAGLAADALRVRPMDDGGMGSFVFSPVADDSRRFGGVAAEVWFEDADGTPVLASLMLDETGALFELDIWKVDFSPLLRWPRSNDLEAPA